MCPIVTRQHRIHISTSNGVVLQTATIYVPPSEVRRKDVLVPVDELSDKMLADLAETHPKEFEAAARERGLLEEESDIDVDAFVGMKQADAIAVVRELAAQNKTADLLALYAAEEQREPKSRPAVLRAFPPDLFEPDEDELEEDDAGAGEGQE